MIEVWESLLHRSVFSQGGSFPMFTQRLDMLSNFHANIIQLQNTFKEGFFADIARRGVFIVQFVDSLIQKSGVPEILDIP